MLDKNVAIVSYFHWNFNIIIYILFEANLLSNLKKNTILFNNPTLFFFNKRYLHNSPSFIFLKSLYFSLILTIINKLPTITYLSEGMEFYTLKKSL